MKPYYPIRRTGPGRLSTMGRPPGGRRLRSFLEKLAQDGVTALVSMLTEEEASALGLVTAAAAAAEAGLEYLVVPIEDFGLPAGDLAQPSTWIRARLAEGGHVVVHCRGGIGRSSLMAGAVLVDEGVSPDEAWRRIADARGARVPDNQAQAAWLTDRARSQEASPQED